MHSFFYGWYFKCQSNTQTLAIIPAIHQAGNKPTCSIQIITDNNTWTVDFDTDEFNRKEKNISIGKNHFGENDIRLAIHTPALCIEGKLDFSSLCPLKYDIMGPFAFVPFMECRHSVWSMRHLVNGTVLINGQKYFFQNDWGYWEGDQGRSFPKRYVWTQCCFPDGSLMLSVADIPMIGIHFTGIICNVLWQGRQYRLATYLGAKAVQIQNKRIRIIQGNLELEAYLLKAKEQPLKAPTKGSMVRTIHESASCRAFYQFRVKGHTLFSFESNQASFEYEYPS